ncbi:MAG: RidA family protein [Rhodothermales bacterium]|nr:RidA family protein [Rhodothermales bacterium]
MRTTLLSLAAALLLTGCASLHGEDSDIERYPFGGSAPLSEAVRVDDVVYLSGKLGLSRDGEQGITAETRRTMENIKTSVEAKGGTMADIVKCTVFLTNMSDYGAMNDVYREYFPENPPARSAVGVSELVANALIEIECIAVIDD